MAGVFLSKAGVGRKKMADCGKEKLFKYKYLLSFSRGDLLENFFEK